MDQVAKLANVGKGTIYTFFKNKEELFDEIISSLISDMKAAANEAFDSSLSFQENVHRPTIRDDMVQSDEEDMFFLVKEEQFNSYQRIGREIEVSNSFLLS